MMADYCGRFGWRVGAFMSPWSILAFVIAVFLVWAVLAYYGNEDRHDDDEADRREHLNERP